jgi:hypothetical protein
VLAPQAATSKKVIVGYLSSAAFTGKWIGAVKTIDKNAAIEEAAELFKVNDWRKLIAVQRR